MKPGGSEPRTRLRRLDKSADWWRRFAASTDASEVHGLVTELSPLELATLDKRTRGLATYRYYEHRRWHDLRAVDVRDLAQSKFAASLIGLTSFHYNGYVRQASVEELACQRTGNELPFLLLRLNDWVVQVREAATVAVRARLAPDYGVHFLANIALVLHLRNCGRVDRKFVEEVHGLLKHPECRNILQAGIGSNDKLIRRTSFQLATEADPSSRNAIIRAVMDDPDQYVRSWAVSQFLPTVTPAELPGVIEPMLCDRFTPVRRAALWAVATQRPDLAAEPLRRALLDEQASMRGIAQQFLVVAGVANARAFYAEATRSGPDRQRFAAICGLGEQGEPSDAQGLSIFLDSPLPKLRRAAVYAVGRLDLEGSLARLTRCLSDAKASVSREALKALLRKPRQIPLNELEVLLADNAGLHHIRRNSLTLLLHTEKWRKLPALLRACVDEDAVIAGLAVGALRNWFSTYNRSFSEPTREDFERIQTVLRQVGSRLPHGAPAELRYCLGIYFK